MSIVEGMLKADRSCSGTGPEEERRVAREQPKRNDAGDPPTFVCRHRVCGHRDAQGSYCPTCLADTMEQVSPAAKAARSGNGGSSLPIAARSGPSSVPGFHFSEAHRLARRLFITS
jgi:hypothetical protein